MAYHNEKGRDAEQIAIKYLRRRSCEVLDVNWRFGHKELDIVARQNDLLLIVEVKSCNEDKEDYISDLLTKAKMRYMVDAAEAYISRHQLMLELRFDLFVVVYGYLGFKVKYIPGVFIPGVNW